MTNKRKYVINGLTVYKIFKTRDYQFFVRCVKRGLSVIEAFNLTKKTSGSEARGKRYKIDDVVVNSVFKKKDYQYFIWLINHKNMSILDAFKRTKETATNDGKRRKYNMHKQSANTKYFYHNKKISDIFPDRRDRIRFYQFMRENNKNIEASIQQTIRLQKSREKRYLRWKNGKRQ